MICIDFSKLLSKLSEALSLAQSMVEDRRAIKLLKIMGASEPSLSSKELRELVLYGYVNKVLLTFMHLGPREFRNTTLYQRLFEQRRRFLKHLASIVEILDKTGTEYVVFKTLRPVIDAPVDIDIIVRSMDEAHEAVRALSRKFKVEVWTEDAYSIGVRITDFGEFVDFYMKPHIANIVYLDPIPLLRDKTYIRLGEIDEDIFVPVPRPEDEFCAILGHSVIKEGLITLNDILTLLTYYKLSSWDALLNRLKAQKLDFAFTAFFKQPYRSLPQRLSIRDIALSFYMRVRKRETLASIPFFFSSINIRLRRFIEHSKRVTYIRGLHR